MYYIRSNDKLPYNCSLVQALECTAMAQVDMDSIEKFPVDAMWLV